MKKSIIAVILTALLVAGIWAGGGKEDTTADVDAIKGVYGIYADARSKGDVAAWLDIHDPEAQKMPEQQMSFNPWERRDGIKAKWAQQDTGGRTVMTINPDEIVIMGDFAYSAGTYNTIFTPDNGGAARTTFEGKYLTVLRKNADGKWLIYRDSFNSNKPVM